MKPKIVKVQKACSENWNEMSPIERGRFCNKCVKPVVDFTHMNPLEILESLQNQNEQVCGRLKQNNILIMSQLPKEAKTHSSYFSFPGRNIAATALLSTGFLLFNPVNVSGSEQVGMEMTSSFQKVRNHSKPKLTPVESDETIIKGQITTNESDGFNQKIGIPNVKVALLLRYQEIYTFTDDNGFYEMKIPNEYIREENLIYFTFYPIKDQNKFRKELQNNYSSIVFEDYYAIFTKKQLEKDINYTAPLLNTFIMGDLYYVEPDILNKGVLYTGENKDKAFLNQEGSCNTPTTISYVIDGDAVKLLAEESTTESLIVIYETTQFIEENTVF